MERSFKFSLLVILYLIAGSVKSQVHYVNKGFLKIGIKVILDDKIVPIDSFSEGFDPETKLPLNLIIPEGSSLGLVSDSLGDLEILILDNKVPTYMNGPFQKFEGFSISSSPGLEHSYEFIDETNEDTLKIAWRVAYNPVKLVDLYPADFFKNYVALQIKYIFESYPDSSQYEWKSKDFISELDDRGLPVNPTFPFSENGLYFVVDQLTENARVQLIGLHSSPLSVDPKDPFALFLYEDLKPGNYEFKVWPYENAPESLTLRYEFIIQRPWWAKPIAIIAFTLFGALIIGLSVFLVYRSSQRRKTRELQWAQQLTQAELKAIRAQLNPHFLFNALNSIQNLVSKGENELANSYIRKLSKYLRRVLSDSEKQFHELNQEIELTELYLELEKLRFEFSVKIEVSNDVPQGILVPVMLLQPYVENAVKHGVSFRGKDGELQILISRNSEFLRIEVIDNGPGLSEPTESSTGIHLGNKRFKNLNNVYSGKASVEITNRKDESGVIVCISLPIE